MNDRELNRATLARQGLLARETAPAAELVDRLFGLQAQEPKPPFVGLWTRLEAFDRAELHAALHDGSLVRATAMRATLHLLSARDFAAFRTTLAPVMEAAMTGALRGRDEGLDLDRVLPAARTLLAEEPRTFDELRALLQERFPVVNDRALGYAVRTQLPLVMVPTGDAWAFPQAARFALPAEPPSPADAREELVRRYLAAFGPATAADVQTWSGLRGMKAVVDGLRPELEVLAGPGGRELFDLPGAPRPAADVPAPPRFLPAFDNLLLAHADRTRVIADDHRPLVVTKNLRVKPTFLVDGIVAGTWAVERRKRAATLTIEPFGKLPKGVAGALTREGEALLAFLEEDAPSFDVELAG